MARIDSLDMPKLAVATILGIIGFGVGILTWLSMPEDTSWLVQGLVLLFVVACVMPAVSVWFHSKAGLAASVVLALSCVIGLQVLLGGTAPASQVAIEGTDSQRGAGQELVALSCSEGAVLRPLMGPNGLRLVFHHPTSKEFFIVGQIEAGNLLHLVPGLTATQQAKLDGCTDQAGRSLAAAYKVKK